MFPTVISNSTTSLSEDASVSSVTRVQDLVGLNHLLSPQQQPQKIKKKRSLPGNPDPDAEVIALSPKALLATNRFVCEICHKGFQRDQNLQLHRRGHNLSWKLKQRNSKEVKKKVYVCPEPSCVHHNPSRALGDLTGIKKHYCRKHGEKKWKCEKCSKIYAVQSDWKAHSKTCEDICLVLHKNGNDEDCKKNRSVKLQHWKDSFITHRAFCDALAEESARVSANQLAITATNPLVHSLFLFQTQTQPNFHNNNHFTTPSWDSSSSQQNPNPIKPELQTFHVSSSNAATSAAYMSATALLQKAATVGAAAITGPPSASVGVGSMTHLNMTEFGTVSHHQLDSVVLPEPEYMTMARNHNLTRDFLGITGDANGGVNGASVDVSMNVKDMLTFTGGVDIHHHHHALLKPQQGFEFLGTATAPETWGNC
ncbi:Zinc finger C2H2-type [Sesbania bispinosa]|nr:Zinc finger C2H2-type [Sesbania bispinosa]